MRVVIVVDSAAITGGANKAALLSAIGLAECGVSVLVFAGNDRMDDIASGVPNLTAKCISTKSMRETHGKIGKLQLCLWNSDADRELRSALREFSPADTIVHFHTFGDRLLGGTIAAAKALGFTTVLTCHDYGAACPTHVFFNAQNEQVCELKPLSPACVASNCTNFGWAYKGPKLTQKFANRHLLHTNRKLDAVVFLSDLSEEALTPYFPADTRKVRLRNAQDLRKEVPAPVASNQAFLFSGRLVAEKAPVLAAIAARMAGVPITFCGDGAERERILLENPQAEITGWLPSTESISLMRTARALVLPSIWFECAPLVATEAQSVGLPIVCSDSCAAREQVQDGLTGYLFRSGDAEDLASKLSLLQDGALAEKLGQEAFDRVWSDPPTPASHAQGLIKLYGELLAGITASPQSG